MRVFCTKQKVPRFEFLSGNDDKIRWKNEHINGQTLIKLRIEVRLV